jgi:hypothetical protein
VVDPLIIQFLCFVKLIFWFLLLYYYIQTSCLYVSTRTSLSLFRLHIDHLVIIQRQRETREKVKDIKVARSLVALSKRREKGNRRHICSAVSTPTPRTAGHAGGTEQFCGAEAEKLGCWKM